ncbi:hypothetical protein [Streptomyces sp. NPDC049881]|uniref:hypothetical protein n=1 Tax=Streptomyces sp. NPDC049881 TaxID=3155778 RepID=UPI00343696D0
MAKQYEHQSVREYAAAKRAGDIETTQRIVREVCERFDTRTTDGSEARELFNATLEIRPDGQG